MQSPPTPGAERPNIGRPYPRPGRHRHSSTTAGEAPQPPVPHQNLYAIVLVDVVESGYATNQVQYRIREGLYDLVDGALNRRGYAIGSFPFEDTGDGLRLYVSFEQVPPSEVVDLFVLGLTAQLRQHRRYAANEARLRVRLAFDLGLVGPHLQGWVGDSLVRVARLIEAEPLRDLLRSDPGIDLAAIVSDIMYQCVVQPADGYIAPDSFQPIAVRVKEFNGRAWLLVPHAHWLYGSFDGAAA